MNALKIPLIKSDRVLFFILFGLGFALCTRGIGKAPVYGWTHPISILGCALGGLALLLGGSVLFRRSLGPITTPHRATVALLGIAAVKFVLAALYPVIP